jgi:hypothetical protein
MNSVNCLNSWHENFHLLLIKQFWVIFHKTFLTNVVDFLSEVTASFTHANAEVFKRQNGTAHFITTAWQRTAAASGRPARQCWRNPCALQLNRVAPEWQTSVCALSLKLNCSCQLQQHLSSFFPYVFVPVREEFDNEQKGIAGVWCHGWSLFYHFMATENFRPPNQHEVFVCTSFRL